MNGFIVLLLIFIAMAGLYLLTFFLHNQSSAKPADEIKEVPRHHHSGGCACGHSSGSCSSSEFKLFQIEKEKSDESIKNFNITEERK